MRPIIKNLFSVYFGRYSKSCVCRWRQVCFCGVAMFSSISYIVLNHCGTQCNPSVSAFRPFSSYRLKCCIALPCAMIIQIDLTNILFIAVKRLPLVRTSWVAIYGVVEQAFTGHQSMTALSLCLLLSLVFERLFTRVSASCPLGQQRFEPFLLCVSLVSLVVYPRWSGEFHFQICWMWWW